MTSGSFAQSMQDLNWTSCILDKSDNKETLVIATHGFIKKAGKVPVNEVDRAVRLKNRYFNNKPKK